jgi:cell division protein FtsW (lipid II flippase)
LFLIAYLASYLADFLLLQPNHSQQRRLLPTYLPLLIAWGISVLLLMVQRDLGTGTLFLLILAVMLYVATGQSRVLAVAAGLILVGTIIGYALIDVVRIRFGTWINPWADPSGTGYQIIQSLISIAAGGIWGSGPGFGSPGYIPVVHSDFIFAALLEEWGLVGGIGLVIAYALLVSRGLKISMENQDPFRSMLAAGISVAFALQGLIIISGVIRLLPLTGVTLPFVSYGGSSFLTSFVGLGFLLLLSGQHGRSERMLKPIRALQLIFSASWVVLALVMGWWVLVRGPTLRNRLDNPRGFPPSMELHQMDKADGCFTS